MREGNPTRKLVLGKTVPVDSVFCRLVACFANSDSCRRNMVSEFKNR